MSTRLRTRLRRLLERSMLADSRYRACPQVQYIDWDPRDPEPEPRCPPCGRKAECILVVEQLVERDDEDRAS